MKRMLIVITRMYASQQNNNANEFVRFWGGGKNEEHKIFCSLTSSGEERIIVVIHGYDGRFGDLGQYPQVDKVVEAINLALQDIQGVNHDEFEKGVLFHPDPNWQNFSTTLSQKIKRQFPNCWVQPYTGAWAQKYNNICRLAEKAKSEVDFTREFDDIWSFFVSKPPVEVPEAIRRLSALKHRLSHLLLPIDIDLQGLMETRFGQDYWEEVAEAYKGDKGEKAVQMLEEASRLIYGGNVENYVAKVVEEAKAAKSPGKTDEIDKAWRKVQALLPKEENCPEELAPEVQNEDEQKILQGLKGKYERAKKILQYLGCQDKQAIRNECQQGQQGNPFHQWFVALDEALDELRDAIAETTGGFQGEQGDTTVGERSPSA